MPRSGSRRGVRVLFLALIATIVPASCDRTAEERESQVAGAAGADTGAAAPRAPAGDECPETGAWQRCNLEKRLERAGFVVVRREGDVRHAFLEVPGTAYLLGGDELQVFLYPSAAARARDLEALDPETVSPRGAPVAWEAEPTLIVSNNLAAILIGGNSRKVERVQDALIAGLPQP